MSPVSAPRPCPAARGLVRLIPPPLTRTAVVDLQIRGFDWLLNLSGLSLGALHPQARLSPLTLEEIPLDVPLARAEGPATEKALRAVMDLGARRSLMRAVRLLVPRLQEGAPAVVAASEPDGVGAAVALAGWCHAWGGDPTTVQLDLDDWPDPLPPLVLAAATWAVRRPL